MSHLVFAQSKSTNSPRVDCIVHFNPKGELDLVRNSGIPDGKSKEKVHMGVYVPLPRQVFSVSDYSIRLCVRLENLTVLTAILAEGGRTP